MVIITYYIIDYNNNFVSVQLIKMYYSLGIELINFEVHALMIIILIHNTRGFCELYVNFSESTFIEQN